MTAAARSGQPLIFWGLIIVGWVCARAVMLLSDRPGLPLTKEFDPPEFAIARFEPLVRSNSWQQIDLAVAAKPPRLRERRSGPPLRESRSLVAVEKNIAPTGIMVRQPDTEKSLATMSNDASGDPIPDRSQVTPASSRVSGSMWLVARHGATSTLASSGQLGGAQLGVRANVRLAGPFIATGRISAPLGRDPGRQASIGVGLRGRNAGVLVERWVALESGGRNDFGLTAYGGFDSAELGGGVVLDGYVQAGIVGRDGFADGALRAAKTVARSGSAKIDFGLGMWGGIQPGVARLDVGPQAVARLNVGGRVLRVSADWRQRVAGRAAPDSGPVVSLGWDF